MLLSRRRFLALSGLAAGSCLARAEVPPGRAAFRYGASFSSLEGTPDTLPGHLNGQVFVTPESHFAYYSGKGLDHIRLQGIWERLQPDLYGPLGARLLDHYADPDNPLRNPVNLVRHYLDLAGKHGLKVSLDLCHNYGERRLGERKHQVGSAEVPLQAFVDYCVKLAREFGGHPAVHSIELMNEPHDLAIGEAGWVDACQRCIDALRAFSRIPIVIDGYGWASAEYWPQRNPTLHTLRDPAGALIFSAHQYFDANSTGTYAGGSEAAPADPELGVKRLAPFLAWLAEHGFQTRGHIGEFGAPDRPEWQPVLRNFIRAAKAAGLPLTAHQDIPYKDDPYCMNLFPGEGADRFVVTEMLRSG
jgi:endoglucanase